MSGLRVLLTSRGRGVAVVQSRSSWVLFACGVKSASCGGY